MSNNKLIERIIEDVYDKTGVRSVAIERDVIMQVVTATPQELEELKQKYVDRT